MCGLIDTPKPPEIDERRRREPDPLLPAEDERMRQARANRLGTQQLTIDLAPSGAPSRGGLQI